MNHADIIAALDSEIQRLQEARAAIAGLSSPKRRGRPPASAKPTATKRRGISAAGRRRIADAQRKRWAAQKTAKGSAAKDETGAARKTVAKRGPKKAAKTAIKKVTVKRVAPKERVERKPRSPKKAPPTTALSSRSETVAVPAASAKKA